jgi:hypothetical protein
MTDSILPNTLLNLVENSEISETITSVSTPTDDDTTIKLNPSIDFNKNEWVLTDGNPKLVSDLEAIKQWIILFLITPKNVYKIYEGTAFGTSLKKLFRGQKLVGHGYEEAVVESEIKDGMPALNPAIQRVKTVDFTKNGRILNISVEVELVDGSLIKETVEDVLNIKL